MRRKIKATCLSLTLACALMLTACGARTTGAKIAGGSTISLTTEELSKLDQKVIEDRIQTVGKAYDGFYTHTGRSYGKGLISFNSVEAVAECEDACEAPSDSYGGASISLDRDIVPGEPIDWNTEGYNNISESGFTKVSTNRYSTFGADVDTATYSNLRRTIFEQYGRGSDDEYSPYFPGGGIEEDAVRIEEMINYFDYSYPKAENGEKFAVDQAIVTCPWNSDTLLYRVGVRAEDVMPQGGSNIVFLIDTSGSMFDNNKLPLAQKSFKLLCDSLTENDRVSIVTYAGSSSRLLEGVSGSDHETIKRAIDSLEAGGGTNGADGINTAYALAEEYFIEGGNNRVILATDGDLNIGVSSEAGLIDLIEEKKESGVFLSCLGFGEGNYMDDKMEALADHGNGNYAYIDCVMEAEKVLKKEIWSTLYTVAKDTKFQVEFNPTTVAAYRLIGYENRKMAAEDFANDSKDGGEVGSGQTVTVLYEIVPVGSAYADQIGDVSSRYEATASDAAAGNANEYCVLNLRYKNPDADSSELRTYPVTTDMVSSELDANTSWAAGVAQVGMIFRDSEYKGTSTYENVIERLKCDPNIMEDDYKAQFIYMVELLNQ